MKRIGFSCLRCISIVWICWWVGCGPSLEEIPVERTYRQGVEALHAGRLADASRMFKETLELAPDSTMAQVRLGEIALLQGRNKQARAVLEGLPTGMQKRPEARLLLARILAFEGNVLQCGTISEEVLQANPVSLDARLVLAQLALQASATMDLARAQELSSEILAQVPTHYQAQIFLLQALLRQGAYADALRLGRQSILQYPENQRIYLFAGTAALWDKDAVAVPMLERAAELSMERHTDRLRALWLLQLAWQQQGGYPDDYPIRYRFHTYIEDVKGEETAHFTDIGAEVGVDKMDRGRGSAWLDFDADGDLDLFTVAIQTVPSLYRNDRSVFTDIAVAAGLGDSRGGWGAATADYDNDGDADLFVSRDAWEGMAPNSLYCNTGGIFKDVALQVGMDKPRASFTGAWGDYDNDGWLDLYVSNGVIGNGEANGLWRNLGSTQFTDLAGMTGVADTSRTIGSAWGDYDNDGDLDLYAVNIGQANRLYRNDIGFFTDRALTAGVTFPVEGGYVAFFFDYDNDGWLDIFASTLSAFDDVLNSMVIGKARNTNRPFLYRNNGDGSFVDLTITAGLGRSFGTMGTGVGDVNSDGYPDIYLANGGPEMYRLEPNSLFVNQQNGTFIDVTKAAGVGNLGKGHGATFADYDNDGDLDLYAGVGGHYTGDAWANSLYRNDGPQGNYLGLELVSRQGNRDAIGARITAFLATRKIHLQVSSGFGFGSSNTLRQHLGLGMADQVEHLEIRWPSGKRQHWYMLPAGRVIRVTEGQEEYQIIIP